MVSPFHHYPCSLPETWKLTYTSLLALALLLLFTLHIPQVLLLQGQICGLLCRDLLFEPLDTLHLLHVLILRRPTCAIFCMLASSWVWPMGSFLLGYQLMYLPSSLLFYSYPLPVEPLYYSQWGLSKQIQHNFQHPPVKGPNPWEGLRLWLSLFSQPLGSSQLYYSMLLG